MSKVKFPICICLSHLAAYVLQSVFYVGRIITASITHSVFKLRRSCSCGDKEAALSSLRQTSSFLAFLSLLNVFHVEIFNHAVLIIVSSYNPRYSIRTMRRAAWRQTKLAQKWWQILCCKARKYKMLNSGQHVSGSENKEYFLILLLHRGMAHRGCAEDYI